MERNLNAGIAYGALFEVNASALRKGLPDAYPQRVVLEVRCCAMPHGVAAAAAAALTDATGAAAVAVAAVATIATMAITATTTTVVATDASIAVTDGGGAHAQRLLALGGRITLSDDSHGVAQVAAQYGAVRDAVRRAGGEQSVYVLERSVGAPGAVVRRAGPDWCCRPSFWRQPDAAAAAATS